MERLSRAAQKGAARPLPGPAEICSSTRKASQPHRILDSQWGRRSRHNFKKRRKRSKNNGVREEDLLRKEGLVGGGNEDGSQGGRE